MLVSLRVPDTNLKWIFTAIALVTVACLAVVAGLYFGGVFSNPEESTTRKQEPEVKAVASLEKEEESEKACIESKPKKWQLAVTAKRLARCMGIATILIWLRHIRKEYLPMIIPRLMFSLKQIKRYLNVNLTGGAINAILAKLAKFKSKKCKLMDLFPNELLKVKYPRRSPMANKGEDTAHPTKEDLSLVNAAMDVVQNGLCSSSSLNNDEDSSHPSTAPGVGEDPLMADTLPKNDSVVSNPSGECSTICEDTQENLDDEAGLARTNTL